MTELELYRFVGEPAIAAIAALSFVKGTWRLRIIAAAAAAAFALGARLLSVTLKQAAVPLWAVLAVRAAPSGFRGLAMAPAAAGGRLKG